MKLISSYFGYSVLFSSAILNTINPKSTAVTALFSHGRRCWFFCVPKIFGTWFFKHDFFDRKRPFFKDYFGQLIVGLCKPLVSRPETIILVKSSIERENQSAFIVRISLEKAHGKVYFAVLQQCYVRESSKAEISCILFNTGNIVDFPLELIFPIFRMWS